MKFNFSIKTLAITSILSFGLLAPVHADDDETPLAEEMDVLSGSLKRLRKAETTAEKVELVHAAQKATIKSLQYSPMVFKDIKDEKEKAKGKKKNTIKTISVENQEGLYEQIKVLVQ